MKSSGILLTAIQTEAVLAGTAFVHLDRTLYGAFKTADFASAVRLVDAIAEVADASNHHPAVSLSWGSVGIRLSSHDAGGVTERDLALALRIQELADAHAAKPERATPARYDVAIDCTEADAIRAFWQVGLGYVELDGADGTELVDPRGVGPRVWFQQMEIARSDRNRIHLDVYVPTADAEDRVQAIVDAGGLLLTDEHAPDWWVLADVEGNELCVCTTAY
ncbi:MAG: 4a-hydroxytetrahydrobiopterin dehydratase [Cryobacterium sp.]|nr:4a-hydroxytetrahydrobiopterin dehydratase [Cryobacterium sp.]